MTPLLLLAGGYSPAPMSPAALVGIPLALAVFSVVCTTGARGRRRRRRSSPAPDR